MFKKEVSHSYKVTPLLFDLRETGQIEQDADVIMLMYREDYYDKETKQRNGPVGSFKLRFLKEFGRFVERVN